MTRSTRKLAVRQREQRSLDKAKLDREYDTIYWLEFVPRHGKQIAIMTTRHPTDDDLWRILIGANPERRPDLLERAIKTFEDRHQVSTWSQMAENYIVRSDYFA